MEILETDIIRSMFIEAWVYKFDMIELTREELPALYLASSSASQDAQKWYTRLVRSNLILLTIGASASCLSFPSGTENTILNTIRYICTMASAFTLIASVIISLIIYFRRFEKDWYAGRAIAESVKTLAWRYMTGTKPYERTLSDKVVDDKFKADLKQIVGEKKFMSGALGGRLATLPQLSPKMIQIRKSSLRIRKDLYINHRIKGQKKWYSDKSKDNKDWENYLFYAIGIIQIAAIFSSVLVLQNTEFWFNPTGLLTSIAASLIAWSQLKQYHILSQSYGLAAQELGIIAIEGKFIKSDQELSEFVLDSENAISREHTLWIARKEKID